MDLTDFIADKVSDTIKDKTLQKVEDKVMAEPDESEEKNSFGSQVIRFFFTIFWFFVIVGVDLLAYFGSIGAFEGKLRFNPMVGAVIEFVLFLVTFLVPLRKKGTLTRWWGWLALLSAIGLAFWR